MTLSLQIDSLERDTMQDVLETLSAHGVDAAVAMHKDVVRIYEQSWNAHTFDFEDDIGQFVAPDMTIVSGGTVGGRSLLCELSNARADYVRWTEATATINLAITCVADLDTSVVVTAEGTFSFTHPDRTTYTELVLTSSTLRFLDGKWVFQHIHCGSGCS